MEIRAWIKGVPLEKEAKRQLYNTARLGFIYPWIAVMPDVHWGIGATVGSVVPSLGAVIPSAVGVDIGCGMAAVQTQLYRRDLPSDLKPLRLAIEEAVPHGRTDRGGRYDVGAWQSGIIPPRVLARWNHELATGYERLVEKYPTLRQGNDVNHLGTLGTGNHFIEICADQDERIWLMLHSGSRGVGNRIGNFFIHLAKESMGKRAKKLPDPNLAWLEEGTRLFKDYLEAVEWAQEFALINRELMMEETLESVSCVLKMPLQADGLKVNCHHNYVRREMHYGKQVYLTRKGAIFAGKNELGIIPGSMGTRSYIVRGLGNRESFNSCSHGAGRICSRHEAMKRFSLQEHIEATSGIECRKDKQVLDETPMAYKAIEDVMEAQKDLVETVHSLKQLICVKG